MAGLAREYSALHAEADLIIEDGIVVKSRHEDQIGRRVGKPIGLNRWRERCHAASRAAGWYTDPETGAPKERNVPEMLALIHSEVSEMLEGYRKNLKDDHLPHRSSIEVEAADVLIRLFDLAGYLCLDLDGAVAEKMAFNAVREDHKLEARRAAGGKTF